MRKSLTAFASSVLVGVMCFTVTACDGEEGGPGSGIISDKITAEEWDRALAEDAFGNCRMESEVFLEFSEGTAIVKTDYIIDGEKAIMHSVMTSDGDAEEAGMNSAAFDYYFDDSGWYIKSETGWQKQNGSIMALSPYMFPLMYLTASKDFFNCFEFNEEIGGYLKKEDNTEFEEYVQAVEGIKISNIVYKFKTGNLVFAGMNMEMLTMSSAPYKSIEYKTIFTYGGQTVETPDLGQ